MPPSASSAQQKFRGRFWVILWLTTFLVVAVAVQARQADANATVRRVADLREQRLALEAERAALERQIRQATSRRILGARAEALGLHFPEDSEFFYLDLGRASR